MSEVPEFKEPVAPNWRIRTWFPELDENTHRLLEMYFTELKKFNKVINLISAKTIVNADATHFADSIFACRIVREKANKTKTLYDFGSGNGFPGIIYGILYADQPLTLVDSDERKCEFLRHVAQHLKLTNIQVQTRAIESLESGAVEQVISRGFSPIPRMLLTLRKHMPTGAQLFHMKGEEWAIEISQIPSQLCASWEASLAGEYALPISGIKMYVVLTVKNAD